MKKPYKVLVIDDEEVIRDSCREILEGEGYELLTAENGATGLALIEEHKPDLILVDVKMPGISGIEVLTRTAEIDPTLVSIVITGYATMELAVECMKKGAFDFVAKPFTPEELRLITRRGLEKRRLVLETLALQKEKELIRDHFAIVVAHEMKTPIAAAVQNISLLVGGYAGELTEKQLALLQRVKNRLDNALAMLQTWLKLTRMDMDALRKKFELLHPLSAVQKAIELLQPKAQAKNIQIVTLFPDSCPDVWGDEGTLVEAISNLVDNAVKYSFENSTVSVKVENKGKEVWISVSDTGVGIDEEDLPFIFDGFYRAKTGKETEQGTGLGLAIAKRIVEAHFGRIKVESAPGKGSTFSIILPQARKKENHNASVDEKAKGGLYMNVPANILIIDDDPDYVEATRTILEKEGYSVDCAYNATEGYEALSKKKYDLILLDIRMGRGAEGVLLARKLKKEPEMKDIPVLIITGIKEQIATLFPGQALSPHLLPIDELLEKPVDPKELLERISALLAKKRGDK